MAKTHVQRAVLEVGIAGMGVGGLTLATMLARMGHSVTIYDQMTRPGPAGSGFMLQPTGLAILDLLGLRKEIEDLGRPINRLHGCEAGTGKTVLDVSYRHDRPALGVQRTVVFETLFRAALLAGVNIETSRCITGVGEGPHRQIGFSDGTASPAHDLVVDAMGARSTLRSVNGRDLGFGAIWATVPWDENAGLDPTTLGQRYRGSARMVGILPVGSGKIAAPEMATFFWSIRHSDRDEWLRNGLDAWKGEIHAMWPEISSMVANIQNPMHAVYRHHTAPDPVSVGFATIGDAYHSTSPQLGQGANMAILDAAALACSIWEKNTLPGALREYVRRRSTHVKLYQFLSLVFTPFYQSDGRFPPAFRNGIAHPLSRMPGVRSILQSMVSGSLTSPVTKATKGMPEI